TRGHVDSAYRKSLKAHSEDHRRYTGQFVPHGVCRGSAYALPAFHTGTAKSQCVKKTANLTFSDLYLFVTHGTLVGLRWPHWLPAARIYICFVDHTNHRLGRPPELQQHAAMELSAHRRICSRDRCWYGPRIFHRIPMAPVAPVCRRPIWLLLVQ